jgi:shikimate dehydrogenase
MTDRYAVMGNPIAHSKSPRIHTLFAAQFGHDIEYRAILVEPGRFVQAVADFHSKGGKGLNITVPFKEEAWALAATRSARAQRAGAVNTLLLDPSVTHFGDNTDGVGLVRDLKGNQGCELAGRRVLLLGAGGAARGVIEPLLDENQRYRSPTARPAGYYSRPRLP